MLHIRKPYDEYDPMDYALDCGAESLTHQNFKEECDINNILARFQKTGVIEHVAKYQGQYGDFTNMPTDYHEAMNQVHEAQRMFMSLPAVIRDQFGNDPGTFLQFAEDPENEQEMRDMGLLPSKPLEAPDGSPEPSQAAQAADIEASTAETPPEAAKDQSTT